MQNLIIGIQKRKNRITLFSSLFINNNQSIIFHFTYRR